LYRSDTKTASQYTVHTSRLAATLDMPQNRYPDIIMGKVCLYFIRYNKTAFVVTFSDNNNTGRFALSTLIQTLHNCIVINLKFRNQNSLSPYTDTGPQSDQ